MNALRRFRGFYGERPLHLLALLASLAVAAYVAVKVAPDPSRWRYAVWFAGAAIVHDLLLFPLYALADRSLTALSGRGGRRVAALRMRGGVSRPSALNHVRVPLLLSGLLLLVFAPAILRRSEPAFRAASGLDQSPFLGRWLLISAVLLLGSAVLLAVRTGLAVRRRGAGTEGATEGAEGTVEGAAAGA